MDLGTLKDRNTNEFLTFKKEVDGLHIVGLASNLSRQLVVKSYYEADSRKIETRPILNLSVKDNEGLSLKNSEFLLKFLEEKTKLLTDSSSYDNQIKYLKNSVSLIIESLKLDEENIKALTNKTNSEPLKEIDQKEANSEPLKDIDQNKDQ